MTDAVYRCPDHGFVTASADSESATCPACDSEVERVVSGDRRRRLSKFVSGALRHFPEDAGLELDDRGWTDYEDLAEAVREKYDWAGCEQLGAVVATDPKGRFESEGGRIRTSYGHSVDVTLESEASEVPDRLYHGTGPENLDAILAEGLKPMGRQEVHLSETPAEAREVGRRHASNPALLGVDAGSMVRDGFRITERGEGTYTTDEVPPEYLEVKYW